ncbi:MAG: tRNA (adenosine(37)-N6)-dimethylallyltransferase MiaA [Actinomycetota bacterium]
MKVAALLGPTAVGKSGLACELAPMLEAEIISVDSMQVYRGMDIGTAKPDSLMRSMVPHHMLDIVDPSINYSVAEFQEAARKAVEGIASRSRLPLLVGGTGLYFEAVVFDLRFPPGNQDEGLRAKLERWARDDPEGIRARLAEVDPDFVASEDFANKRRVIRAMEVYELTGRPLSEMRSGEESKKKYYNFAGVVLSLPRQMLYRAIEERVDDMMRRGLVEEVKELVRKVELSRTARQALGYKEILEYLDSRKTLEETILDIKRRSRRYAKRQLTWFRHIRDLRWYELKEEELAGDRSRLLQELRDYIEKELQDNP